MEEDQVRLTGWQISAIAIVVAVGILVLGLVCCSLGLVVGGAAGFSLGRATARPEATPEWEIPVPVIPTPEFPPEVTPVPGERPYLGIRYIQRPRGAEVQEVIPGSPAEEAGLRVGDLIRKVDGQAVNSSHPLADVLSAYRPGDRVVLTVEREGREIEIPVTLGRRP
jgi:membrane-associated protease RseP (regulator of RpoE activity)